MKTNWMFTAVALLGGLPTGTAAAQNSTVAFTANYPNSNGPVGTEEQCSADWTLAPAKGSSSSP